MKKFVLSNVFYTALIICFLANANGQKIILVSPSGQFYGLDISSGSCVTTLLNIPCNNPSQHNAGYSDALFKDTLYYNSGDGNLYRSVIGDPTGCKLLKYNASSVTLTVDKNGILYWVSFGVNMLIRYDPHTNKTDSLGILKYPPAGDLVFYKNKLILASGPGLIEVNIQHPEQSTVYMPTTGHYFLGLINIALSCNVNKIYGIEPPAGQGNDFNANLVKIDMENKVILGKFCSLPIGVYDAASTTESGGYEGVIIDSIKRPYCTGNLTSTSIQLYASTSSASTLTYTLNNSVANSTGIFNGLVDGNYAVNVSTKQGCSIDTIVHINLKAKISFNAIIGEDTCGNGNGSILIKQTAGDSPLYISFNNDSITATQLFKNLDPGYYTLRITDTNYCVVDTGFPINKFIPPPPSVYFINKSPDCFDKSNGSIQLKISNFNGTFFSSINGGNYQSSNLFSGLNAGDYAFSIKSSTGCVWSYADHLNPFQLFRPTIASTVTDAECWQSVPGKLSLFVSGTEGPYSYNANGNWYPSTEQANNLPPGNYTIDIKNVNGCIVDSVKIFVQERNINGVDCDAVFVPTAFTPNGDGKNDLLKPLINGGIKTFYFRLFDRWGKMVFETNAFQKGWDGTINGKGQAGGTYIWTVDCINSFGQRKFYQGTVVLIR